MAGERGIRFGPAGIPIQCSGSSTLEGVRCCHGLGLGAMEMEFVRGVRLAERAAGEVAKAAEELDISISSHALYYVNFCSKDEAKMANSRRHLFESAKATHLSGGRITVFHPGFYQKLAPQEAYAIAKRELAGLVERLKQHGIKTVLGAETVGKKSAFGSIYENIKLAQELEQVEPVPDFAHLLARGDFPCRGADDYRRLLGMVERELPGWTKHMHCHFSEINYSDKGELNHLPLGTNNEPPWKALIEVLAENGYRGTIICETPKLDIDALAMQKRYQDLEAGKPGHGGGRRAD
jgi:deoxyribonuclease-4